MRAFVPQCSEKPRAHSGGGDSPRGVRMLGERRNSSLFARLDESISPAIPASPETVSAEDSDAVLPASGLPGRSRGVFFVPEEPRDFTEVLRETQDYVATTYAEIVARGGEDECEALRRYIADYLREKRLAVNGMSDAELVDALYAEMAEFGFLTKYIYGDGIEEIDINSWRDVEVQYSNGRNEKLDEHFTSPEHAVNVVRRMLHASGSVLDNANPIVTAQLATNIRIAAIKEPVVDREVGVAASIRIVNKRVIPREEFVSGGTATEEMLDWLAVFLRYGISVCVAGATSSGKTTLANWLLTTVPDNKRIFTIENGSRELNLVKERGGKVVNSVVHTQTRDSEIERQRIDQMSLMDASLRFNPDILVVGEMRGPEADAAQEAARTGVAVLTTIHSNSCEATYRRMVSLCKRSTDISDETLMGYVTEAYPIVVFCKQLENRKRRLMEIMECSIAPDGLRHYESLFLYRISEDRHIPVGCVSESLQKRLVENGMPAERLEAMLAVFAKEAESA